MCQYLPNRKWRYHPFPVAYTLSTKSTVRMFSKYVCATTTRPISNVLTVSETSIPALQLACAHCLEFELLDCELRLTVTRKWYKIKFHLFCGLRQNDMVYELKIFVRVRSWCCCPPYRKWDQYLLPVSSKLSLQLVHQGVFSQLAIRNILIIALTVSRNWDRYTSEFVFPAMNRIFIYEMVFQLLLRASHLFVCLSLAKVDCAKMVQDRPIACIEVDCECGVDI